MSSIFHLLIWKSYLNVEAQVEGPWVPLSHPAAAGSEEQHGDRMNSAALVLLLADLMALVPLLVDLLALEVGLNPTAALVLLIADLLEALGLNLAALALVELLVVLQTLDR